MDTATTATEEGNGEDGGEGDGSLPMIASVSGGVASEDIVAEEEDKVRCIPLHDKQFETAFYLWKGSIDKPVY